MEETKYPFYTFLYVNKRGQREFGVFSNYETYLAYQKDVNVSGQLYGFNTREEARAKGEQWVKSEEQIPKIIEHVKEKLGHFFGTDEFNELSESFQENEDEVIAYDEMSNSQKTGYTTLMTGYNCFVTGMAGTGKSTLIQKFIKDCEAQGKTVLVTGATGISSQNIGGITIHKALGIPWNDPDKLIRKDWREVKPQVKAVLRCSDVIIIDEISMIDYVVFEYIVSLIEHSNVNRKKRDKPKTQLVVVGDFLQLPPVVKDRELVYKEYYKNYGEGWCFNSEAWHRMKFQVLKLTEVMRQNEADYIDALMHLKVGDRDTKDYFNARYVEYDMVPENAIHLYGRNDAADARNAAELEKVDGELISIPTTVIAEPGYTGKIELSYPEVLNFKIGARVMATANGDVYQNGSIGTVTAVRNSAEGDIGEIYVMFDNGKQGKIQKAMEEHFSYDVEYSIELDDFVIKKIPKYTEENFPLKLAYAITIHKSQGQTFDKVIIEPTCFANGQLYVALSRCKSYDGIYLLKKITDADIRASHEVIDFERDFGLI